MTTPDALMSALRVAFAAAEGVSSTLADERAGRSSDHTAARLRIASLERDLSEAAALNRALQERLTLQKTAADKLCQELRERIAKLEFDEVKLRDRAASLAVELNKRELAIVDLVLKGTN